MLITWLNILGLLVHPDKVQADAVKMVHIGYKWELLQPREPNTAQMKASKRDKYMEKFRLLVEKERVDRKDLESVVGIMNHLATIFWGCARGAKAAGRLLGHLTRCDGMSVRLSAHKVDVQILLDELK